MTILIGKQTTTATGAFRCDSTSYPLPVTIIAEGLAGAETVALNISADGGSTYIPATDAAGAILLTATSTNVSITSPGMYQVVKTATIAASSVAISTASAA